MKENYMENQAFTSSSLRTDDEIDLRQVFGALLRHKDLITKITIATLILSGIYAFTRKPVWKGHFQMVLEDQSSREDFRD